MIKAKSTPIFRALRKYAGLFHFFINWGGRGSGKSHSIIEKLILDFVNEDRCNYLFGIFNSSRVIPAFKPKIDAVIKKYNLDLRVTESPLKVRNSHGQTIFCTGFDDPEKAKEFANIGKTFIDELPSMPEKTFKTICDTTREIEDFEIHAAFNPVDINSWVKKNLLDAPYYQKNAVVIHSTCEDNPFLPESIKEAYRAKEGIDKTINYEGQFGTLESDLIFAGKLNQCEEIPSDAMFISYGLDFSNSPSSEHAHPHSLVATYYYNNSIYIDEIFEGRCPVLTFDDNNMVVNTGKKTDLHSISKNYCDMLGVPHERGVGIIVADNANGSSIDQLEACGVPIMPSKKGQGSILAFVDKLSTAKNIFITSRSTNLIRQFYNWRWKKDRNDEIIPETVDLTNTDDNGIAATRYALELFEW